jgi:isoleucyl-tRNA synthetase
METIMSDNAPYKILFYFPDSGSESERIKRILIQQNEAEDDLLNVQDVALRYIFKVSQVEILDDANQLGSCLAVNATEINGVRVLIGSAHADGQKCERCWWYSIHVGESEEHPTICERCVLALQGKY